MNESLKTEMKSAIAAQISHKFLLPFITFYDESIPEKSKNLKTMSLMVTHLTSHPIEVVI